MDTWFVLLIGGASLFTLIYIIGMRWLFRVNEQILLLQQIWEQLRDLNNKTKRE